MSQIKLTQLTTESTLADIAHHDAQININRSGNEVLEMFRRYPELPGVVVIDGAEIVALISQKTFHERLIQPYSAELFLRRSLKVFLDLVKTEFLQLSSSCTIGQAVKIALERPKHLVYEPIIVIKDRKIRLLDVHLLLLSQSQILASVNILIQQQQQQAQNYLELLEKQQIQLQQSKEKLKASEERYRNLVELSPETIAVHSEGKLDYINYAGVLLLGAASTKDLIGQPIIKFIHPRYWRIGIDKVKLLQEKGNKAELREEKWVRLDGKEIDVEVKDIPTQYSGKPATQLLLRDITERKQAQEAKLRVQVAEAAKEELFRALEKEKELSELKSRFVTMASHEFRTPLTTILSSTELLECYSNQWSADKKTKHFHRIIAAVKHMTGLLNDVLLIGKAEAGKLEFQPTQIELIQFCRELVEEIQLTTNSHSIFFSNQEQSIHAYMDEKLLRQILSNLLSNAIKYSPQSNQVSINLTCQLGKAIFQVQDQGIGIPAVEKSQLFNSFHRASNVGTIAGTGLGLAIVKKAVDLHGGEITVESEVGAGTTFTVTLALNNLNSN